MGRRPSTAGGAFYLLVLVIVAVCLVVVALGPWRQGVVPMGAVLLVAAGARTLLPSREAGMLAVRSRWFDVLLLAGVGLALILLGITIPDQPPL